MCAWNLDADFVPNLRYQACQAVRLRATVLAGGLSSLVLLSKCILSTHSFKCMLIARHVGLAFGSGATVAILGLRAGLHANYGQRMLRPSICVCASKKKSAYSQTMQTRRIIRGVQRLPKNRPHLLKTLAGRCQRDQHGCTASS